METVLLIRHAEQHIAGNVPGKGSRGGIIVAGLICGPHCKSVVPFTQSRDGMGAGTAAPDAAVESTAKGCSRFVGREAETAVQRGCHSRRCGQQLSFWRYGIDAPGINGWDRFDGAGQVDGTDSEAVVTLAQPADSMGAAAGEKTAVVKPALEGGVFAGSEAEAGDWGGGQGCWCGGQCCDRRDIV